MIRQEIIARALGAGAAHDADSATVAATTIRALGLLLTEIKPLMGELAMHALYVRASHLARSSFARPVAGSTSLSELLAPLQHDLAARAAADARRASEALLRALVELLSSLIGQSLTYRLLRTAWSIPAAELPVEENA